MVETEIQKAVPASRAEVNDLEDKANILVQAILQHDQSIGVDRYVHDKFMDYVLKRTKETTDE